MSTTSFHKVGQLIGQIRIAMMFSHAGIRSSNGQLHGRPMYTYMDPDTFIGELTFLTDVTSNKALELQNNPDVLLSYADVGHNTFLTVRGKATVMRDPAKVKEVWNVHAKAWFPNGPTDPNIGILQVVCEEAEFWEGPSKIVYALSVAKAVVTGHRPDISAEHAKVRM